MPLRNYKGPLLDGASQGGDPNPKVVVPEGMELPEREADFTLATELAEAKEGFQWDLLPTPVTVHREPVAPRHKVELDVTIDAEGRYHVVATHKHGQTTAVALEAEAATIMAFSELWEQVNKRCPTCGQLLPEEGK